MAEQTVLAVLTSKLHLTTRSICEVTGYSRPMLYKMFGKEAVPVDTLRYREMINKLLKHSTNVYNKEMEEAWAVYKEKQERINREYEERNLMLQSLQLPPQECEDKIKN